MKSSIDARFDELKNLILNLPPKDIPSAQPPPTDPNSKSQKDGNLEDGEEEQDKTTPKPTPSKGNGSQNFSAMPGPTYTGPPLPAPHYAHVGNPPMLDASSFANWQFLMRSHLSSASTELWRIVEEGYYPVDPSDITTGEYADKQHNATALNHIQRALTSKDLAHIRKFTIAKEAWDYLTNLFIGNESSKCQV